MTAPADTAAPQDSRRTPRPWTAAALAAAQLALIGPVLVFVENRQEFVGGSWSAALYLLGAFVVATALLAAPALVFRRAAERWSAAVLALTALMWGQSFVAGRFGLLDGTRVDWAASRGQEIAGWVVWVAALAAAVLLARRLLPWLWRLALLVVVVQVGAVVFEMTSSSVAAKPDRDLENLARFAALSPQRNVLVLVLDAVRGREAEEVLAADASLRERFDGFRFYRDNLAAFPTTRFSIPMMLSSRPYDNKEPAADYVQRALNGQDSLARRLTQAGFDVGVASTMRSVLSVPADIVVAAEHYSLSRARRDAIGLELVDLSLFRHLPLTLKRWVHNEDQWRVRRLFGATADYHATRSLRFLEGLVGHLKLELDRPAFRFAHVGGAHVPLVVDSECRFVGVRPQEREAYREQVACALRQALLVVESLEALGVLDESLVVITSDHGTFLQDAEAPRKTPVDQMLEMADALLLVKPFGARGELVFDPSPTAEASLADWIVDAATAEGSESMPPPPAPAEGRVAFFHEWQHGDWRLPYLTSLHEFRVGPGASQQAAWRYVGTTPSPDLPAAERAEQTRIGRRMATILERSRRAAGPSG